MKKLLVLLLLAAPAYGKDVTVSWTLATTYVDGTPLAVADIESTRVEWGTCSGSLFGTSQGVKDVAAPNVSTVVPLNAGTYCFRAFTVATDGQVSDSSNVTQKVVRGKPSPPVMK